ncbi:MAG TPA: OmpH family outer membrane protein [Allosphingosinicella sp.]|nr:OmpH family outer membrane protein [Allosphingosinicella sp.]
MNKIAFGAALAALSLAMPGAALAQRAPAATIVVVDSDRIYRDCNACRAAQTQLQSQVNAAQQRAQALGQPIQTEGQSIEQAARAAANQQGAARTAAETALQQRITALQTRQNTANQELQRLEQNIQSSRANVLRQINARLNPIISQVMNARGANLAVDTNATLAHAPALEVTAEVLAALNQQLPSVSVTPLPQQQQPTGR